MATEYVIAFDTEKCVACHGCVVACKAWRERPLGVRWRRLERLWTRSEDSMPVLRHASINCRHCVEPACLAACPWDAIRKRAEDGVVYVDQSACVGCRSCEAACPFGVPQFGPEEDAKMQKCDLCPGRFDAAKGEEPPCVATCPTRALELKRASPDEKRAAERALLDLLGVGN